jgi:hypothetical protein
LLSKFIWFLRGAALNFGEMFSINKKTESELLWITKLENTTFIDINNKYFMIMHKLIASKTCKRSHYVQVNIKYFKFYVLLYLELMLNWTWHGKLKILSFT